MNRKILKIIIQNPRIFLVAFDQGEVSFKFWVIPLF